MKFFSKSVLISALFLLTAAPGLSQAALIDKIKAVVNNEVITQSEVDRLLYPVYERYKYLYQGEELEKKLAEASGEILNQLIENKLILSEAKKQGIKVDERELDERVAQMKTGFPNEEAMAEELKKQNLTIKDLEQFLKEQIMAEKMVDLKIRSQIQILPQEAKKYYDSHIDKFKQPEQVKVSAVLIRLDSERTSDQSLALAVNLLNRIKAGEDFYALAKNYSEGMNAEQGGDMGYVKKGQMIEEIDKVIFNLKIGEVSDLVKTSLGYHIFKVQDRQKATVMSFIEAQPAIIEDLFRQKAQEKYKEWIEDSKSHAFISIK